ncbi:circadian clock-controlled protein-like [Spodoptera litura]|uniref:Circadian clock-controlled protein-like n=1 Tax=Spodoptera litura TaxID=69820 RepID=A0A3G1KL01_SPOLT|nr:circadian clock-controlled protein-like [Spodoptera litura]ATU07288.1 takeout [Spodoptera litura]
MFKSQCLLLCLCYVIISAYGNAVPFIDKCEWKDQACIKKSAQKAIPSFANGLPEYGVKALDPININKVSLEESGLSLTFEEFKVVGLSKVKILSVDRDEAPTYIKLELECPIDVTGTYTASGQLLFVPIEGHGPFQVKTNNIYIWVKAAVSTVDGSDGEKHWKIGKFEYTYEAKTKTLLDFKNLFNGDKNKAAPIEKILDENWSELMKLFAKPIISKVIHEIKDDIQSFVKAVPSKDLEV